MFDSECSDCVGRIRYEENSAIVEILRPGYVNYGHGTNREVVNKILDEGIRVNESYGPLEILLPLPSDSDELSNLLEHWPHKNADIIIVVSVPKKGFRFEQGKCGVVGDIYDPHLNKRRSYIPSRFIRGYYDVTKDVFVPNDKWQENPEHLVEGKEYTPVHRTPGSQRIFKTVEIPGVPDDGTIEVL